MAYAELLGGLAIILIGCAVFTNGIEWVGKRLALSEGAIGSVFAAVGTALPETMIPVVAIALGEKAHDIGIGAILGAPFMLATLGFLVCGAAGVAYAVRGRRLPDLELRRRVIRRDLRYFLMAYPAAIAVAFVPVYWLRVVVALGLAAAYVRYVSVYVRQGAGEQERAAHVDPLYVMRWSTREPATVVGVLQTLAAIGAIVLGARIFVNGVNGVAAHVGISAQVLSLIIAPVATELPEKLNSVIWVGRGRDTLALGNMTGAMVFQSCFPTGLGMCFTEWRFQPLAEHIPALASVVLALSSGLWLWFWLRRLRRVPALFMLGAGLPYIAFALVVFTIR
jgi:cation:H+ antiporter